MIAYTYRAEWDTSYGEYLALCLEFPGRFFRAPTAPAAIEGIEKLIAEEVVARIEVGLDPPPSITDRKYSGNFVVRMSSILHGRLAVEAAEQRVSLNHHVVTKLAGRLPSLDDLF